MKKGDLVKLTDGFAMALMRSPKSKGINWLTRRGTVYSNGKKNVTIKWPDRTTLDQYPHKAVERA